MSGDLWAGAEVQVFQLCCALKNAPGVKVGVITFNKGLLETRLRQAEVTVHVIDETQLSPLSMARGIVNTLEQEKPDVVHTHGQKENILGTFGAMIARIPNCVRTVHGNPETGFSVWRLHKPLLNAIDTLVGRFAQDGVIVVSEQLKKKLSSPFRGKVLKINNFIDIDSIRNKHLRSHSMEPRKSLHIGLVGRLVPVKRADLFIGTLDILRREYDLNFKASVIGDGPLWDELHKQVNQCGLNDLVEFIGFLDPVYPALARLDLLVVTSDHEGLPMVVIEAQALEVPIVAHSVGGLPDALAHGKAGRLVTDHTANGYAKAIAEMVTSGSANNLRNFALDHAKAEFGWRANSEKYLRFYQSLDHQ